MLITLRDTWVRLRFAATHVEWLSAFLAFTCITSMVMIAILSVREEPYDVFVLWAGISLGALIGRGVR